MVNPKTVTTILNNLRQCQDKLDILADYPRADFLHWDINDGIIYDILQNDRADFEKFVSYILSFLTNQSEMEQ